MLDIQSRSQSLPQRSRSRGGMAPECSAHVADIATSETSSRMREQTEAPGYFGSAGVFCYLDSAAKLLGCLAAVFAGQLLHRFALGIAASRPRDEMVSCPRLRLGAGLLRHTLVIAQH